MVVLRWFICSVAKLPRLRFSLASFAFTWRHKMRSIGSIMYYETLRSNLFSFTRTLQLCKVERHQEKDSKESCRICQNNSSKNVLTFERCWVLLDQESSLCRRGVVVDLRHHQLIVDAPFLLHVHTRRGGKSALGKSFFAITKLHPFSPCHFDTFFCRIWNK